MNNTILTYILPFLLCIGVSTGVCQSQVESSTIQGQVTDNHNNPLSDYTISAVSQTGNITYAVKTTSGGQFALTNLPSDTWNVTVRHFSTLLTQREFTVTENTEVNADFVIEGTGGISGFLLDSVDRLPLQITDEIQIGLLSSEGEWIKKTYQGEVSNGYFKVDNLLSGHYQIIDAFDGYVFDMSNSYKITVYPNSNVGGVEVLLKPGASLSGVFVDAENGSPISGVSVNAAAEVRNTVYPDSTLAHETETNSNGEFHLTIPNDPDTYYAFTLIASHPQYQTNRWRREISPNKIKYRLGKLELKPFLSLQGKVPKLNTDYAIGGLTVQIKMHNKPGDFFRAGAQPEHTVHTDAEGSFLFSELHPIDYSLTISRNDAIIAYLETVNPQSKKSIKIHLPKTKILHGNVVDTQQRPIADANLYAARRSENPYGHSTILSMTQTDANGDFRMQLIDTKPHLISIEASKKGYLSRVYPNVEIDNKPLVISLEKGFTISGRVILPWDVPIDEYYEVKVFPADAEMESTLNPLDLNKPLLSKRFPVAETVFVLDGLFEEKYKLYIVGNSITATETVVKASAQGDKVLIVADRPTVALTGQVLWSDTDEPVQNALISRSWYPWELTRYDMSLTLDRFETETDGQGRFAFQNLTQERYQLHIRAVQSVFDKETQTYQTVHIQKQVTVPFCSDNTHRIYLGKADGTPYVNP